MKMEIRRHYIAEWLEERGMEPTDLLERLNESGEYHPIDKSQVYRWIKGQMPQKPFQIRIAAALDLLDPVTGEPDPEAITRDPTEVWIARAVRGKPKEEVKAIRQMIDLFIKRTGTDG